jgi:hypothetical protein
VYDFEPIWLMKGQSKFTDSFLTHFNQRICFVRENGSFNISNLDTKLHPVNPNYKQTSTSRI